MTCHFEEKIRITENQLSERIWSLRGGGGGGVQKLQIPLIPFSISLLSNEVRQQPDRRKVHWGVIYSLVSFSNHTEAKCLKPKHVKIKISIKNVFILTSATIAKI